MKFRRSRAQNTAKGGVNGLTPLHMQDGGPISRLTITETIMRLLLALILPWLQFFTIGRPIAGIVCLILQITLIGWIPAAIWSVYALSQYKTDEKIREALGSQYRR